MATFATLVFILVVSLAAVANAFTVANVVSETTLVSEDGDCALREDTTPTIKLKDSYCGSNSYTLPASAGVVTQVCVNKHSGGCESSHDVDNEETVDYDCIPQGTTVSTQSVTLTCAGSNDKTIDVEFVSVTACDCAWTAIRRVSELGTYNSLKSYRTST